jgi:hypothetical protein
MVIKNVDSKRPQIVQRTEVSSVAPTTVKKQEAAAPDSGFQSAKQKLINMTGARPKVQLKGNPELLAYVKTGQATGGQTAKAKMPSTVDDFLKDAVSSATGDLKTDYENIKKAINKGDFTAAAKIADGLMSGKADDKEEAIDSDLGIQGTKSTKTMTSQLDFLAGMEKAGVKPVSYPPTEKQLTDYFATLKDNPAGAREAFDSYTHAFHAHPSNAGKAKDFDLKYGDGATRVPDDWSEVANRPIDAQAENIGKQMNDCEGFAFMAEKLLGAAGFQLQDHLTAHGAPAGDHAMVAFKHPSEKTWTVTSNDKVFTAKTEREGAEKGFKYASGAETPKKTQFFQGKTMLDSQNGSVNSGKHI